MLQIIYFYKLQTVYKRRHGRRVMPAESLTFEIFENTSLIIAPKSNLIQILIVSLNLENGYLTKNNFKYLP